jgi:hypothetical protein
MGHGPRSTSVVTTRIGVGLVGIEVNYTNNIGVGLLNSYLARISI